jgi:hypothetical protein
MLEKMKTLWAVFQAGKSVADPAKWKLHQVSANAIAALLFAVVQLGRAFGYDFGIDMQTCADIAIGILAIANVGLTVATTKHIGLPSGAVRETEQTVQSVQSANISVDTLDESAPVQDVNETNAGQPTTGTIDEATRRRAIEWVRFHTAVKPSIDNSNGLASDA